MDKQLISFIDDDEFIQRMLRDTLELDGYRTSISGSAEECYRKLGTEIPHLFVIDIILPGQDGIQLCKNLRKQPLTRYTPIIMLSSKARVQDRIIGLEAGADDYLVKPFHLDELLARIKAILRRGSREITVVDKSVSETKKVASQGRDATLSKPVKRSSSRLNENPTLIDKSEKSNRVRNPVSTLANSTS